MGILGKLARFVLLGWILQLIAMLATGDTAKESDGQAVNVDLLYSVDKDDVAYVDGWLGVAGNDGDSGDTIALDISCIERQIVLPASTNPSKGDIIYIEVADCTGHIPDDTAYGTSAGEGKVAFCKITAIKDDNNVATAIILPGNLAS
jgi:hypothetical protein